MATAPPSPCLDHPLDDDLHDPADPQQMGVRKVRLPGRRRLCKLGDTSDDDDDQPDAASWETEEPSGVFLDCGDDEDVTDQEEESHRDTDTEEWEEEEEEEDHHDTDTEEWEEEEEEEEEEDQHDTDTEEWKEDDFQMEAAAGSGKPPYRLPARVFNES
ncbi:uncharacterized protein [Aegilops tauschii subsp. strangulata]|uniref:uncharacterized protein n=1 Tax=Aegilops tauschii subsp. strangulata TaxID=200361 RepID=UPI001E1CAC45|nr:histone H3.v1-like [Aegilops tauschii subsp. strangulata]